MSAAITALSWELLASCRWRVRLTATCLVLVCLIGLALPESWRSEELGVWLVVCMLSPGLLILDTVSHVQGSRLEDTGSLFPARLFTLPVPSAILAAPPLVLGTLLLLGSWLVCVVCLLRPWGIAAPLLWPGLVASAVLASIQAMLWFPFPWRWLRSAVLLLIVPGLIFGSLTLAQRNTPEAVLIGLSLAVLMVGYACAFLGVSQGRHGKGTSAVFQVGALPFVKAQEAPQPFLSPLRAQQWFERRRMSLGFLLMTAICVLFSLGMVCLFDFVLGKLTSAGRVEDLDNSVATLRDALLLYGRSWLVLAQLPLLPLLIFASVGGSTLGKLTVYANNPQPSAFLATRPMHSSEMIRAKLLTCVLFVSILWTLMFLTALLWATVMGRLGEMSGYLLNWTGSVPAALLALIAGMILLPVISWLWLISGMWVGVLRGGILEGTPAILSIGLFIFAVVLTSGKLDAWWPMIGAVVALGLMGKMLAVVWVVHLLRRDRLADARTIMWALVGWCLLAGVVLGIAVGLFSVGPTAAGFVVLLLPLARLLAAPLALARHRTQ